MSQSYHEQFRENRRNNNQNGLFSNSKATAGSKLSPQRPTASVKQAARSDTFTLPPIRNGTNSKAPKNNQIQNGARREIPKMSAIVKRTPPAQQKRTEDMHKNVGTRPIMRQTNSMIERGHVERKPVRFANAHHNTYSAPPASLPIYYQKPPPVDDPQPRDAYDGPRRMRVANDDYVVHRRAESPAYAYDDYRTVSDIPTISYFTSFPPINQPTHQTSPTVIIRPKENHRAHTSTKIPTVSIAPPAPFMFFPQTAAPSYPPNSTMFLPNPNVSPYSHISPMILPMTRVPNQSPGQHFFLQPSSNPNYFTQPYFYPMPQANNNNNNNNNPPTSGPPLPPQTIISQSSFASASAPAQIKTEEKNTTFIVRPDTTNKKNVTIQVKMIDEDGSLDKRPQRVRRVVRDPPYYEADDRHYNESEPVRVVYEQPRRRRTVLRRPSPPPTEYVYVDESPSPVVRRRPARSDIVYVDDDRRSQYEDEVIYVDQDGNEVDYIYDDEPVYHRRNYKKSRHPPSTNIVYE
ncbi:unnamed protein product [Rotaria magnacalcarata]|uniref:Uncharacterized protein n=1 Tax=Rotaria magnacalcarata TaxID=392030 RepID=A0A819L255_9BILA|nr:unnamed protein product [Rotaria magnacalcarata]